LAEVDPTCPPRVLAAQRPPECAREAGKLFAVRSSFVCRIWITRDTQGSTTPRETRVFSASIAKRPIFPVHLIGENIVFRLGGDRLFAPANQRIEMMRNIRPVSAISKRTANVCSCSKTSGGRSIFQTLVALLSKAGRRIRDAALRHTGNRLVFIGSSLTLPSS